MILLPRPPKSPSTTPCPPWAFSITWRNCAAASCTRLLPWLWDFSPAGVIARKSTPSCRSRSWTRLKANGLSEKLVYLNPIDPFNLYLKIAALAGLFLTSPFVLYQVWMFISPGLYRNEKRYVVPFMASTIALFSAGGYFGYRIVYPRALDFLIGFGSQFQPMITISEYTSLFLSIILGMGLIFEMPILIFFLALMGIVSAGFMWKNFRYAILIIFIVAAIVTPSPDPGEHVHLRRSYGGVIRHQHRHRLARPSQAAASSERQTGYVRFQWGRPEFDFEVHAVISKTIKAEDRNIKEIRAILRKSKPCAVSLLPILLLSFAVALLACDRDKDTGPTAAQTKAPAASDDTAATKLSLPSDTGPPPAIDSARAFQYVKEIVAFGPRPLGSANHKKVEDYILAHLKGDDVENDTFTADTPEGKIPSSQHRRQVSRNERWHHRDRQPLRHQLSVAKDILRRSQRRRLFERAAARIRQPVARQNSRRIQRLAGVGRR